jgi:hypothetical protein
MSLVLGLTLLSAQSLWAQSAGPVLDPVYALDSYLSGQASADAGRLVVYDTFYPANTKLGEGTVDANGTFGISLKLPLEEGHTIVVQDSLLRVSPPVTVQAPRTGPAAARP